MDRADLVMALGGNPFVLWLHGQQVIFSASWVCSVFGQENGLSGVGMWLDHSVKALVFGQNRVFLNSLAFFSGCRPNCIIK